MRCPRQRVRQRVTGTLAVAVPVTTVSAASCACVCLALALRLPLLAAHGPAAVSETPRGMVLRVQVHSDAAAAEGAAALHLQMALEVGSASAFRLGVSFGPAAENSKDATLAPALASPSLDANRSLCSYTPGLPEFGAESFLEGPEKNSFELVISSQLGSTYTVYIFLIWHFKFWRVAWRVY